MKKISYESHELFPSLVWKTNLDREFTKEEQTALDNNYKECTKYIHPQYRPELGKSKALLGDTYLLNCKGLESLKEEILIHIKNYFSCRYEPKNNIDIYMTQSWMNIIEKGEHHPRHTHSNSIISGVLYLQTVEGDKISFQKPLPPEIQIETNNHTKYNSPEWSIPVKNMDLLLFCSTLSHQVPLKMHEGTRMSLSFNTFVKGTLGLGMNATELIL
tara:strand:- start:497 stop:1144 length:648 start_codon:yes stop_codon:yes gene_type:complete